MSTNPSNPFTWSLSTTNQKLIESPLTLASSSSHPVSSVSNWQTFIAPPLGKRKRSSSFTSKSSSSSSSSSSCHSNDDQQLPLPKPDPPLTLSETTKLICLIPILFQFQKDGSISMSDPKNQKGIEQFKALIPCSFPQRNPSWLIQVIQHTTSQDRSRYVTPFLTLFVLKGTCSCSTNKIFYPLSPLAKSMGENSNILLPDFAYKPNPTISLTTLSSDPTCLTSSTIVQTRSQRKRSGLENPKLPLPSFWRKKRSKFTTSEQSSLPSNIVETEKEKQIDESQPSYWKKVKNGLTRLWNSNSGLDKDDDDDEGDDKSVNSIQLDSFSLKDQTKTKTNHESKKIDEVQVESTPLNWSKILMTTELQGQQNQIQDVSFLENVSQQQQSPPPVIPETEVNDSLQQPNTSSSFSSYPKRLRKSAIIANQRVLKSYTLPWK